MATPQRNAIQRIASLQLQGKNGYQQDLLKILANDADTLKIWSAPLTKTERQDRNNAIFDHWLAGETTVKLAESSHLARSVATDIVKNVGKAKRDASDIIEQPPIYNVWNMSACDSRFGETFGNLKLKEHPGRIPGQAIVNLLLWLTEPFDIVVDPMAGGGTTIDVCRYLLRRYYCYDIDPRRPDIKQWDIRKGYPRLPQKPNLIILDPPYWRLKREEYSQDGVAMTSYSEWLGFMAKLAKTSLGTVRKAGHVALFIQSFHDEWESHKYIFANRDCFDLFIKIGFEGVMEISLNIPSQVKTFRDVNWAKQNHKLLSLKREIYVFRKP